MPEAPRTKPCNQALQTHAKRSAHPARLVVQAASSAGQRRQLTATPKQVGKQPTRTRWLHTLPVSLCRRNRELRFLRKPPGGRYLRQRGRTAHEMRCADRNVGGSGGGHHVATGTDGHRRGQLTLAVQCGPEGFTLQRLTARHGTTKPKHSTQQLKHGWLGRRSAAGQGIGGGIAAPAAPTPHAPAQDVRVLVVLWHQLARQHRPGPLPCRPAARRAPCSRCHGRVVGGGGTACGGSAGGGSQGGRCRLGGLLGSRGGASSAQGGHRAGHRSCRQGRRRLAFRSELLQGLGPTDRNSATTAPCNKHGLGRSAAAFRRRPSWQSHAGPCPAMHVCPDACPALSRR